MHLRRRVDRHVVDARSAPAAAAAAPRRRTPRPGRHWVVPWTRSPARSRHHVSARRCASARSMNVSPAKNEPRTNGTVPLDPWLVLRRAHPGRVDHEPAGLGVLDERLVQPGLERIGAVDDRRQVVGDQRARTRRRRTPTPPRTRRSPPRSVWRNVNHTKQCRLKHGGEDQRLHDPVAGPSPGRTTRPIRPKSTCNSSPGSPSATRTVGPPAPAAAAAPRARSAAPSATAPPHRGGSSSSWIFTTGQTRRLRPTPRSASWWADQQPPRLAVTVACGADAPPRPPAR